MSSDAIIINDDICEERVSVSCLKRKMKRRRCELSDDDFDELGTSTGKQWDDPETLKEMGLGMLATDSTSSSSSSDEGDVKELVTESDCSVTADCENEDKADKRPAKKRKLTDPQRQPLREHQSSCNIQAGNAAKVEKCVPVLEDGKLEKLMPSQCVIKNSKVIYGSETLKSDAEDRVKKKNTDQICNSEFKLSRIPLKKMEEPPGIDYISQLPDEVLLEIFKKLERRSLVRCCFVSRRFNEIAKDESLWCRVDLGSKNLPIGSLGHVLARGPLIVRMAFSCVPDPQFLPRQLQRNFTSKIQYLDLSMAAISAACLTKLIGYCNKLKKLSVENCHATNDVMAAISRNKGLEVLNMTMCTGLTDQGLYKLFTECTRLQSVNLAWTSMNRNCVQVMAKLLPSSVERLNISGCRHNLSDSHVKEILLRCDNLIELDISDCIDLTEETVQHIAEFGDSLEYLAVSRCYSIPVNSLKMLNRLDSLIYLDMFGLCCDIELRQMKAAFDSKKLNQFTFSSVARPTVGIRRTSIWGLRVRD